MNRKGFTLTEILLYVVILGIISGLFVAILATTTKVQLKEFAGSEVGNQLNFVLQTIQRLVRESSHIEFVGINIPETSDTEFAYLKLRMQDSTKDPTCISLVDDPDPSIDGVIRLTQGPAGAYPNDKNCKTTTSADNLITAKVSVATTPTAGLQFAKLSNAPGHDAVQIDLTLTYVSSKPESQITKTLKTAVGRVSAATFDSNLIPGSGSTFDIGIGATRWKDLFLSGNLDVLGNSTFGDAATDIATFAGTINQAGNYDLTTRGFFTVSAPNTVTCTNVCSAHGLSCNTSNPGWVLGADPVAATCGATGANRLCYCE